MEHIKVHKERNELSGSEQSIDLQIAEINQKWREEQQKEEEF